MTLIKSISGIRGTIGGKPDHGLTPLDIVKFCSAFAAVIISNSSNEKPKVVIGRDARTSGEMVSNLVIGALLGMGVDVLDLGLSTTPTVEMAVVGENAQGGIILTASHNPSEWNALKLLNEKGEFISAELGDQIVQMVGTNDYQYADVTSLGKLEKKNDWINRHIVDILNLELVDQDSIGRAGFKIVVDSVDSTGGISIPSLLEKLGVEEIIKLNCEPTGEFSHNPEPLPENITDLIEAVKKNKADLGIVVDPDVDRLAFVSEDGSYFGEEYTLVAVASYILSKKQGNTVSNLSSSRALRDVTINMGGSHFASAVGEVNVVAKMKEENAIIGGEGNGGIIYPELHYGRDALVGIALFLSGLAIKKVKMSEWRNELPQYFMSKMKINLSEGIDVDYILKSIAELNQNQEITTIDGVKIDFEDGWVHLRKSNTEPIIRVYSEANSMEKAEDFANLMLQTVNDLTNHKV